MHISSIKLKNFRNYSELNQEFGKNLNIIYGNNAQGKTNIVEAFFLCAAGRSQRTAKDNELIKAGEDAYYIKLELERTSGSKIIEIFHREGEKKRIRINEIPVKRMGDLIGNLNTVMFSPEDLMLIKQGPSERRRFIDISLSQAKPSYFYDLQQYARILAQRNMLLKELQSNRNLHDTLEIWNRNLANTGARIIKERDAFTKILNDYSSKKHAKLTDGSETLSLQYIPSIKMENIYSMELSEIAQKFLDKLESSATIELIKAITMHGPHRDDIDIIINGMNAKMYASQGQQRTAVLSLKLSEIEIIRDITGDYPVLLLDDVMSELDDKRQEYLYYSIKDLQTFVTSTSKRFFEEHDGLNINYYEVINGTVNEKTKDLRKYLK